MKIRKLVGVVIALFSIMVMSAAVYAATDIKAGTL